MIDEPVLYWGRLAKIMLLLSIGILVVYYYTSYEVLFVISNMMLAYGVVAFILDRLDSLANKLDAVRRRQQETGADAQEDWVRVKIAEIQRRLDELERALEEQHK